MSDPTPTPRPDTTPWAQMGRVTALQQITRHELDAGWRPGEGDDQ